MRSYWLATPIALALLSAGCLEDRCHDVNCSPCPDFVAIDVRDANGGPVAGVIVEGFTCSSDATVTSCSAMDRPDADVYDVTISAPGYVDQVVHVDERVKEPGPDQDPGACCPGCHGPTQIYVTMVRAG